MRFETGTLFICLDLRLFIITFASHLYLRGGSGGGSATLHVEG